MHIIPKPRMKWASFAMRVVKFRKPEEYDGDMIRNRPINAYIIDIETKKGLYVDKCTFSIKWDVGVNDWLFKSGISLVGKLSNQKQVDD
jgi:hypothetical protein